MNAFIYMLAVVAVLSNAAAMTIEEYSVRNPEEKVRVLTGRPDRLLSDPAQILRLYTMSLNDASPLVQKAAAQASALLVSGLQSAKPGGRLPSFAEEDSAAFQQALVRSLHHQDETVRVFSAIALAYSAAPNAAIEGLLLSRVRVEPMAEVKGAVVEAMAQAGYRSPLLIAEATALVQPSIDSTAIFSASKALAHLRSPSALDTLITLASQPSPSQQHALLTLASYGQEAASAIPMLEGLIGNQTMPEDMRNLATITLGAIRAGQPQPSSLDAMKPVDLWPVAVAASSPAPATLEASSGSTTPPPQVASTPPPAPITTVAQTPAASVERKAPVWPWLVGVAALVVIVAFFAKRKS